MAMRIKTHFAKVIVDIIEGKAYYSILYFDPRDGEFHIGYSSYAIENALGWLREHFELIDGSIDNPIATMKEELKMRCAEIEELNRFCDRQRDENSKLGLQHEKLLKEKSDLDRKLGFLEGQVEAYRFIWGCRKERQ